MATAPKHAFEYIVKEPDYCSGKPRSGRRESASTTSSISTSRGRRPMRSASSTRTSPMPRSTRRSPTDHDHMDEIEAELAEDEGADERYEQRKAKALAERHGR